MKTKTMMNFWLMRPDMLFTLVLIVALLLIYVGLGLIWMSSDKANPEGFLGFFFMPVMLFYVYFHWKD